MTLNFRLHKNSDTLKQHETQLQYPLALPFEPAQVLLSVYCCRRRRDHHPLVSRPQLKWLMPSFLTQNPRNNHVEEYLP